MSLHAVKVTPDFSDMKQLQQVNNEAFPAEERIPLKLLVEASETEPIDLLAIYDDDLFVGFLTLIIKKPCAYICFFAIDGANRSKGYGGQTLNLIKELYSDYQIVLDLERLDENAPNNAQRISRKKFYLRNGFYETGYVLDYLGMSFEVLCSEKKFDKGSFLPNTKIFKSLVKRTLPDLNPEEDIDMLLHKA